MNRGWLTLPRRSQAQSRRNLHLPPPAARLRVTARRNGALIYVVRRASMSRTAAITGKSISQLKRLLIWWRRLLTRTQSGFLSIKRSPSILSAANCPTSTAPRTLFTTG
uniref:Uncharacterized protein n=1 Tax=Sphingopyxis macrogoltabida TaxID=33050 RepID=E0D3V5_SPHMC|nr:hypothetical protein [Sphingopyxis macrogoltabida]